MEEEEKKTSEIAVGTLYDINKNLVKNKELKLSEAALNSKRLIVRDFIHKQNNNYYMLLCNERKDYTVFDFKRDRDNYDWDTPICEDCARCLIDECLTNRGEIRGIDLTKDKDAIEIWMIIDDEAYVYYFFPYDNGVISDF
jgi:hypothetical protein